VEEKKTGEKEPGVGCRRSEYRRILTQGETGLTNEVIVVEYDPRWPSLFEEEKARLLGVVGDQIEDIQRIGSTAVPGLGAKPIIDIQVSLLDLVPVQKCVGPLESIGYEYLGEYGVPGRAEDVARVDEIEQRHRTGLVTHEELVERFALVWPHYFVHLPTTVSPPAQVGVEASIGTNRSLSKHFEAQTLMRSLPDVRVPVLFVHGEQDPLPLRSTDTTAGLIPGSRVATIPDCSHFPWLEQPAAFRSAVEELLS